MRPLPTAPSLDPLPPVETTIESIPAVKISHYAKSKEAPFLPLLHSQLTAFLQELSLPSVPIKGAASLLGTNRFLLWSAYRLFLFQVLDDKSAISLISLWDLSSSVCCASLLSNEKAVAVTEDREIVLLNAHSTDKEYLAEKADNRMPSACLGLGEEAFVLAYGHHNQSNCSSRVHLLGKASIWISEFECKNAFLVAEWYAVLIDKMGTVIVIDLSSGSFRLKKSRLFNGAAVCAVQRTGEDSFYVLCDDGLIWRMQIECSSSQPPTRIVTTKELYSGIYNGRFLKLLPEGSFVWIVEKHYVYLIDIVNQSVVKEFGFSDTSMEHVLECGGVIFLSLLDATILVLDAHNTAVKASLIEELPIKRELSISLYTWNTGNCTPQFPPLPVSGDLIVVGLQEIIDINSASSLLNATAVKERAFQWTSALTSHLCEYNLQGIEQLFGIYMAVFTHNSLGPLEAIEFSTFKTGMNGYHGNKGAVGCRFCIDSTWISIVNAHLAAGESNLPERNIHANSILRSLTFPPVPTEAGALMWGGRGERVMDYHCAFFMGDLNYRVHQSGGPLEPSRLENDELRLACKGNPHLLLRYWEEMPIIFPPTYKYDPGTCNFDSSAKQRQPSWTDRILFLRGHGDWMKGVNYCSTKDDQPTPSDHRAVLLEALISVR